MKTASAASTGTSPWLQVNVALARPDGTNASARASARGLFAGLAPLLEGWRRQRRLSCFYFQRKPPDVRLRFRGPAVAGGAPPALRQALTAARRTGCVARWFSSVYEPEVRKFGGPGAMAAVHDHFDADTRCWLALDRLRPPAAAGAGAGAGDEVARTIAPALADDLVLRCLGDPVEVWDVWCNLVELADPARVAPAVPVGAGLDELLRRLPGEHAALLAATGRANDRVAQRLRRQHDLGRLQVGLRGLLALVVQHDLQRWGLDGTWQGAVARAWAERLNPHRRLRGA